MQGFEIDLTQATENEGRTQMYRKPGTRWLWGQMEMPKQQLRNAAPVLHTTDTTIGYNRYLILAAGLCRGAVSGCSHPGRQNCG